jgi:D-alanyl-D-alanine carboxypeptidase/D-alanyl-D-alanine-endopeptidase (penicillin-binding protein 4)
MYLNEVSISTSLKNIKRNSENNNLTIPKQVSSSFQQSIPFHLNKTLTETLITDTLLATGSVIKPVVSLPWKKPPTYAKTMYSIPADSLYKQMLQMSDNFIAEELLLNCAAANHLTMRTDSVISVATKNLLSDMPHKTQWVDGSGLSRLNLFTPLDMTTLLQKIYDKVGNEQRLFNLLPAGGQSGTLKNMFKSTPQPFVFAKSGGLTNNYNLSGYLVGKSGKKYIFSFMNNNFLNTSAEIRQEVDRILTFVHDNY